MDGAPTHLHLPSFTIHLLPTHLRSSARPKSSLRLSNFASRLRNCGAAPDPHLLPAIFYQPLSDHLCVSPISAVPIPSTSPARYLSSHPRIVPMPLHHILRSFRFRVFRGQPPLLTTTPPQLPSLTNPSPIICCPTQSPQIISAFLQTLRCSLRIPIFDHPSSTSPSPIICCPPTQSPQIISAFLQTLRCSLRIPIFNHPSLTIHL
ncbi:hypothetical protein HNQ65_003666 [Prosthecobacter vanneervenii]|uniref:Uncharacterized protein n=1 Tax=Prosthecobacter vanneervenii TaxID=48466 RepID=A0A7W7YDB5_9BACT|nr:hypothetical protein [Prosthecobacter vanneervenii]